MRLHRVQLGLLWAGLSACGPGASPFDPVVVTSDLTVKSTAGFADERGDAVLLDDAGQVIRVRADGQRGALEPHPGNRTAVGGVHGLFPMGPHAVVVAAAGGVFLAQAGWILSPGWTGLDPAGVVGAADPGDGTGWIAHRDGLFQVKDGAVSELKVGGESVQGLKAVAAARGEDGSPVVWFAAAEGLKAVVASGPGTLAVRAASLSAGDARNVRALAALGDSQQRPGELWMLSDSGVFRLAANGWQKVDVGGKPAALAAGGRTVWVKVPDSLLRYDADEDRWTEARGLTGTVELLASDAAGGAWLRLDGKAASVNATRAPRLLGIDQNMAVAVTDLPVQAVFPAGAEPLEVRYQLGSEEVVALPPAFSMGGEDGDGAVLPYSLLGLMEGLHTLRATARYPDDTTATREVPFDFRPVDNAPLSWDRDIRPIHESRCTKCHTTGPGHDLSGYEQWRAEAAKIAQATRDRRMPADGPLDPALQTTIARWAQTGAAP